MKAFNKLFSLVVASVLVFSLAGCGDKEESKKFSANLNGTEIAITYVYKGDKVLKQSSETKIQFASIGATTKEDAAKTLEPLSAKYKNIAGVEEKLTYTDTYAQENVTIDMEKVDFKALQGISGINVSAEDAKKGITMAQMELVMKAAGFKEVNNRVWRSCSKHDRQFFSLFSHAGALPVHAENNVKIDRRIRGSFYDPVHASSL